MISYQDLDGGSIDGLGFYLMVVWADYDGVTMVRNVSGGRHGGPSGIDKHGYLGRLFSSRRTSRERTCGRDSEEVDVLTSDVTRRRNLRRYVMDGLEPYI